MHAFTLFAAVLSATVVLAFPIAEIEDQNSSNWTAPRLGPRVGQLQDGDSYARRDELAAKVAVAMSERSALASPSETTSTTTMIPLRQRAAGTVPPSPYTSTSSSSIAQQTTSNAALRQRAAGTVPPSPPTSTSSSSVAQQSTSKAALRERAAGTVPPYSPTSTSSSAAQQTTNEAVLKKRAAGTVPPSPPTSTSSSVAAPQSYAADKVARAEPTPEVVFPKPHIGLAAAKAKLEESLKDESNWTAPELKPRANVLTPLVDKEAVQQ